MLYIESWDFGLIHASCYSYFGLYIHACNEKEIIIFVQYVWENDSKEKLLIDSSLAYFVRTSLVRFFSQILYG